MFAKLIAILATAVSVSAITIDPNVKPNQNGNWIMGEMSQGYFYAPKGSTFHQSASAKINLGQMSTFILSSPASFDQDKQAEFDAGSYTLTTLDTGCKFSMAYKASVSKNLPITMTGRSEVYCNDTFSMGDSSYISMEPQTLLSNTDSFTLGKSIIVNMQKGAALNIDHSLIIQDYALIQMEAQSRFDILSTSSGVVSITSSTATPPNPTSVWLEKSAKIICEGSMTIGSGKATSVKLQQSGLLQVGPSGSFSIASSKFLIGPSSFWIINGTFDFGDGSSLSSGLQSNITIAAGKGGSGSGGNFKTLNGGSVHVGAGASVQLTGNAQISGNFTLSSAAHVAIGGQLTLNSKSTLSMDYASTASVAGTLTLQEGALHVMGPSSGFYLQGNTTITLMNQLIQGERSYLGLAFAGNCFQTKAIILPPYKKIDVHSATQASNKVPGLFCVPHSF